MALAQVSLGARIKLSSLYPCAQLLVELKLVCRFDSTAIYFSKTRSSLACGLCGPCFREAEGTDSAVTKDVTRASFVVRGAALGVARFRPSTSSLPLLDRQAALKLFRVEMNISPLSVPAEPRSEGDPQRDRPGRDPWPRISGSPSGLGLADARGAAGILEIGEAVGVVVEGVYAVSVVGLVG